MSLPRGVQVPGCGTAFKSDTAAAPGPIARTGPPGHRLADREEVGRAVHERDPPDRRTAAGAGPALLAVGVQRAVEVAGLAVDVDVERVEARAALAQRRRHHGAGLVQHLADLGARQPGAGPL